MNSFIDQTNEPTYTHLVASTALCRPHVNTSHSALSHIIPIEPPKNYDFLPLLPARCQIPYENEWKSISIKYIWKRKRKKLLRFMISKNKTAPMQANSTHLHRGARMLLAKPPTHLLSFCCKIHTRCVVCSMGIHTIFFSESRLYLSIECRSLS